jgi:carboxymethylenebutenolidase
LPASGAPEDNPVQNVTFPSNGGEAHGYLALPPSGSGPGLIVIQEWWGLTTHVAAMTDRFAAAGYVALAPDLYGGPTTHDGAEAAKLAGALPADRAVDDLSGAVDYLLGHDAVTGDRVGVVGFCMGGGFVLALAAKVGERIAAAVPFYGVPSEAPDYSGLTASVLGHYGTDDAFISVDGVNQMADAIAAATGVGPDLKWYPAGHAFMNDENLLGTYDAAQAQTAWDRTITFLGAQLG